jgi:DNA-directed RNA polymerase specialized sigma24 family protein
VRGFSSGECAVTEGVDNQGLSADFQSRDAVARYLLAHKDRIRAVARRKLTGKTRSVFDSEDVLSSVLRRVDALVLDGKLCPRSEAELWGFVDAITRNNAVSRTRLIERARNLLTDEEPYAYELLKRLNAYTTDDEATLLVYRMMSCLQGDDRHILSLFVRGATHKAIADFLKTSEGACRQRWMRIRHELQARFARGVLDG